MDVFNGLQELDRQMGHPYGWADYSIKDADQGIARHVYACFSPNVKGEHTTKHYNVADVCL
jgi:hypothetical protein